MCQIYCILCVKFSHLFRYLDVDIGLNGVKNRTCVANCDLEKDRLVSNTSVPVLFNSNFCFVPHRILILNRCVHKKQTETINSIIRTLRLDSFYRVRDLSLVLFLFFSFSLSKAVLWKKLSVLYFVGIRVKSIRRTRKNSEREENKTLHKSQIFLFLLYLLCIYF